jgi:hypothetical protein
MSYHILKYFAILVKITECRAGCVKSEPINPCLPYHGWLVQNGQTSMKLDPSRLTFERQSFIKENGGKAYALRSTQLKERALIPHAPG